MSDHTFTPTPRTTATRKSNRLSYDRELAYAIIDEAWHCHLSFVGFGDHGPEPRLLPTLHVRIGQTLFVHGSTGSRPLLDARGDDGLAVAVAVTHLDGLVLARSQTNHSANYRSVIVHGRARLVTDADEKLRALTAFVERVTPGRTNDSRPPTRKEIAETAVLALPLTEVSVKIRQGPPVDEEEDLTLPHWAGVIPLRVVIGAPEPDPNLSTAAHISAAPDVSVGAEVSTPSSVSHDLA